MARSHPWHRNSLLWTVVAGLVFLGASPAQAAAPEASDLQVPVEAGQPLGLNLNDQLVDTDGDPLVVSIVTPPSHGALDSPCAEGICSYTSDPEYVGADTFTFKANDGTADSNVATVTIDVFAPGGEPTVASGVTALRGTIQSPTSVLLTWENPDGVTGIIVRYAAGSTAPATTTDGAEVTIVGTPEQVVVSGLTTDTLYSFSVFAISEPGTSGPESVEVTPTSCPDLAGALDAGSLITGGSWVACAGLSANTGTHTADNVLPRVGENQAAMTSGSIAGLVPEGDDATELGTGYNGANDVSIFRVDLDVPADHTCLLLDYVFASAEYPQFVGSSFNDGFIAQLDQLDWGVVGTTITAPGNFAKLADGSYISVNGSIFSNPENVILEGPRPPGNGTALGGMTPPLIATSPITSGEHSIYLSIFDVGDDTLDSAVILDNLRTTSRTCSSGSNRDPIAGADSAVNSGSAQTISVLTNDVDPDGQTLTIISSSQPANGTVSCTPTECTYTPTAGYTGPDSFTYVVSDGVGGTAEGTVTISAGGGGGGENVAPVAGDDVANTNEDASTSINVLANDVDADDDTLTITAHTSAGNGSVSCTTSACTYTPTANFHGSDSFTYTISDGQGHTDTGTVNVTVGSVNDAPNAVADSAQTTSGQAKSVSVLMNDTDADGDSLTVTSVHPSAAHGTVDCTASGCTYTSAASYSGSDSFTYTISDGHGGTDSATVSVSVAPKPSDLKIVSDPVIATTAVGTTTGYKVTVTNIGGTASTAAKVTIPVTTSLKLKTLPANCTLVSGKPTCTLSSIAPGASRSVTISGAFVKAGTFASTAVVTVTPDASTANNSDAATATAVGQNCTKIGTFDVDTLTGTSGVDVLCGLSGNDVLTGAAGNDHLYGNEGNDSLDGGTGNDNLVGAAGTDVVRFSSLATSVVVNLSAETATGQGSDHVAFVENVIGSTQADTLTGDGLANSLTGAAGDDILRGAGGVDSLQGNDGNDTLDGGTGNDKLVGAAGTDVASFKTGTTAVTVSLSAGTASGQGADTIATIEDVVGSPQADKLTGNDSANTLSGLAGNDVLKGAGGNDKLLGGDGNDTIDGGLGTDTCSQGTGTGTLTGCP